jgi:hypothetical protein
MALLVVAGAAAGWWSGTRWRARPGGASRRRGRRPLDAGARRAVRGARPGLRRADEAALAGVYAPSSPGGAADARLVRALAAAGRTAEGVRHHVSVVDEVAVDAERAELRVVDRLGAYDVRDAAGAVVARRPGRARRSSSSGSP